MNYENFDYKNPDYSQIFRERAIKLKRIRENPGSIPYLLAYYRENPAQFINDWGCTFDPRNIEVGLPAVIPFILFPRQEEWIDWVMGKWKSQRSGPTVKSRDMGLSWLSVALACTLCATRRDVAIGFGSRKQEYVDKIGAPKSLFHKARSFMNLVPVEFRGGYHEKRTSPLMKIGFPNMGSVITGESGDGIGRGDRAAIYFVDESAFLERPKLVEASLSQTTNCRIDISTPNGRANPFAEKVLSGKFDPFYFLWRDDPRKDEAWYQRQKEELDPVTLAQEVDIDFNASIDGVLIPAKWVQSAIDAHEKLGLDDYRGDKVATLDVADLGLDKNAQCFIDGVLVEDLELWHGSSVDDIFGTTQRAIDNCEARGYSSFYYDSDGLGAGCRGDSRVINEIRVDQGLLKIEAHAFHGSAAVIDKEEYVIEPSEFSVGRTNESYFANYKAQSWWHLRMLFKKVHEAVELGVSFEIDEIISISSKCSYLAQLQSELAQVMYTKDTRGKILIVKTPDGMSSPNLADSVMMARSPKEKESVGFFDMEW
ncbi:conserved hypothetical protein [Vibrio chagasii]|nr:conserved hypothetical protein [Vibrio chagasii]